MIPNLPFPNLEMRTQGNIVEAKLKNQDLANMLKKAIESRGHKVINVEVYPDAFVVIMDISHIEKGITNIGLKASIEPKQVRIVIDRQSLIDQFVSVSGITNRGFSVQDMRDYILIRGTITR